MIIVTKPVFTKTEAASVAAFLITGDFSSLRGAAWDKLYEMYFTSMPYGTAKARDGDPAEWIRDQYQGWNDNQIRIWADIHAVDL